MRIAWVSAVSVLFGMLLFFATPQAQDLFLEVRGSLAIGWAYWTAFYLLVFFAWSLPVYLSSRWILAQCAEGRPGLGEIDPVRTWVRRILPPLLAIGCVAGVLLGQMMAVWNAPAIVSESPEQKAEKAEKAEKASDDKLATKQAAAQRPADKPAVGTTAVPATKAPGSTGAPARRAPSFGPDCLTEGGVKFSVINCLTAIEHLATSAGRDFATHVDGGRTILLGYAIVGLLILWRMLKRRINAMNATWRRVLAKVVWWIFNLVVVLLTIIAAFVLYGFTKKLLAEPLSLAHLAVLPAITIVFGFIVWRLLRGTLDERSDDLKSFAGLLSEDQTVSTSRVLTYLFYAGIGCSILLTLTMVFIHPVTYTQEIYRALMVPMILGLLVPMITWVSYWSVYYRVPLILAFILAGPMLLSGLDDMNHVRTLQAERQRDGLHTTVMRWAEANGCKSDLTSCPRPIVIAAAGGASRAAFLSAGLVGKLLDETTNVHARAPQRLQTTYFSPSGERLISVAAGGAVQVWNARTGAELTVHTALDFVSGAVARSAANSSRTRIAVTLTRGRQVLLLDGESGAIVKVIPATDSKFSDDGLKLIARIDGGIGIFAAETGDRLSLMAVDPSAYVDFNRDATRALVRDHKQEISELRDVGNGALVATFPGMTQPLFNQDGSRFLYTPPDPDPINGVTPPAPPAELRDALTGARIGASVGGIPTFSQDGRHFVTTLDDHTKYIWSSSDGRLVADVGKSDIYGIDFSPVGSRLAIFSDGASHFEIRDLEGGTTRRFPIAKRSASAWSPDGRYFVATDRNYELRLVDTSDGSTHILTGPKTGTPRISFSADSRVLQIHSNSENQAFAWGPLDGGTAPPPRADLTVDAKIIDVMMLPGGRILLNKRLVWRPGEQQTYTLGGAAYGVSTDSRVMVMRIDAERSTSNFELTDLADGKTIGEIRGYGDVDRPLRTAASQIFAISGVSGGSLGAVIAYAALADAQLAYNGSGPRLAAPCKTRDKFTFDELDKALPHDTEWFGWNIKGPESPNTSWKSCLQLIAAGDFLSPVAGSLVSTDLLNLDLRGDRSVVLENAWEKRYAEMTGGVRKGGGAEPKLLLAQGMVGLRDSVLSTDPANWLPVLLLNGTSVETGRRIITSDIELPGSVNEPEPRLFRDAYALPELLASKLKPHGSLDFFPPLPVSFPAKAAETKHCADACDVSLATAVTTSARFPVVSPHGNLTNRFGVVVDRIVDGGYFENFGAITARELVEHLKSQYAIKARVILINNQPEKQRRAGPSAEAQAVAASKEKARSLRAAMPSRGERGWCVTEAVEPPAADQFVSFSMLRSPVDAVGATRQARGTHAAAELCATVGSENFAYIQVKDDVNIPGKELSMSWWLSKHVQKKLDDQLSNETSSVNFDALRRIESWRLTETQATANAARGQ